MNLEKVKKIADAVLYEGYILYPYRPSAVKNQQRWNFGTVYPREFAETQTGADAWTMQTECLILGNARLAIKIRFLQIVRRGVYQPETAEAAAAAATGGADLSRTGFRPVASLEIGGRVFQAWQEAVEKEFDLPAFDLAETAGSGSLREDFSFAKNREPEILRDEKNRVGGLIVRKKESIEGSVGIDVRRLPAAGTKHLYKVRTTIRNRTPLTAAEQTRDEALMRGFVSTHTVFRAENGEFVSLLEPADEFAEAAAGCENIGTYPVLVGEPGERRFLLSSPIILYDYPQIAPESAGDYFDGTEMDEMLALRILTLTDEEKNQMSGADEKTRQLLERTENMPPELLLKLHGKTRDLRKDSKEKEKR